MKDNKLIAEFMGAEWHKDFFKDVCIISPSNISYKFHASWDWLMPVLKKINLKLNPQNYSRWVRINKPTEYLIDEVHQAAVDFIKNQNNEKL
tara:strand:+ start:223 stop:498 length:276 start_codon:yes stop_codon:yes gene_type:complete